jgi:hypothetical protein
MESIRDKVATWLHMREFGSRTGIYAKWYSGKHDDEKIAFFQSLIGVVRELSPNFGDSLKDQAAAWA